MYTTNYTFGVETKLSMQAAREKVEAALMEEGFGIMTEIDVQATLKKKINADYRPYLILGACNPQIAYEAFQLETEIGALLPCNVTVYQNDTGGTNISFMDPFSALQLTVNRELARHALLVKEKLMNVARKLEP